MPIPTPRKTETKEKFIERCMSDETMVKEYPQQQRAGICYSQWERKDKNNLETNLEQAKSRIEKLKET